MVLRLLWPALAAPGAMLAGCTRLLAPDSVFIARADIERALAREFPRRERLLEVLEVDIAAPAVRLLPERNRVATDLAFSLADRLFGSRYEGRLALDYALRYDEAAQAVRLHDVRVEGIRIEGEGRSLREREQRIAGLIAESLLDGFVLRRLRPEEAERLARAGIRPGDIEVAADGIRVRLGAAL